MIQPVEKEPWFENRIYVRGLLPFLKEFSSYAKGKGHRWVPDTDMEDISKENPVVALDLFQFVPYMEAENVPYESDSIDEEEMDGKSWLLFMHGMSFPPKDVEVSMDDWGDADGEICYDFISQGGHMHEDVLREMVDKFPLLDFCHTWYSYDDDSWGVTVETIGYGTRLMSTISADFPSEKGVTIETKSPEFIKADPLNNPYNFINVTDNDTNEVNGLAWTH